MPRWRGKCWISILAPPGKRGLRLLDDFSSRSDLRSLMRSVRRVAVITGTRAEFGLLEPLLKAIQRRDQIKSQLVVTGMHLLPRFGRTIDGIRRAGWKVAATVRMQTGRDDVWSEAGAAARGIDGIARALRRLKSDVAVVLGDRIEAFSG